MCCRSSYSRTSHYCRDAACSYLLLKFLILRLIILSPGPHGVHDGLQAVAKLRQGVFYSTRGGTSASNSTKDVYKDMQKNPEIEISVSSPSYAWIRLHGKAVFENNMAVKEMCIANPIVKGQYQTADNPIFEVFYLENAHGLIADFSGNPPYEF